MSSSAQTLQRADWRACDLEPIHIPGSIQPHGVLLAFDRNRERLVQWAGDCEDILRLRPTPGLGARDLFGTGLDELLQGRLLVVGREPVHVGSIARLGGQQLSVSAHRTRRLIIIELEVEGEAASAIETLERVRAISDGIAAMATLDRACDAAAAHVRAVSGFDRVMVYKFMPDASGSVVAESRASSAMSFLGHRFPASDIPAQARALYTRNLLRVIVDVGYSPVPLEPAGGEALDMSNCLLRSVSPAHIQYLTNMGARASMSVSVIVDGALWGLIACHHSQARRVSADARLLCRHVGTTLSAFIQVNSIVEGERTRAAHSTALEDVLSLLRSSGDPELALRSSAAQLLSLVSCGGVALLARGALVATAGRVPGELDLRWLAEIAERATRGTESYATDSLGQDYPEATRLAADASGLLAVRIDGWRQLMVLWLRPEQVEEIAWAGNPHSESQSSEQSRPLTPRRSFATWRETVQGRSRPWSEAEVKAAQLFRWRGNFILQRHRLERVNEQLEEANSRLTALATTDPLTGLANRRLFEERLATEWKRSLRDKAPLALIALDADNFKTYNDRFGHPAGDECLRRIAGALDQARRSGDVAARVGGEEFALLLPRADMDAAQAVAERLRSSIEELALDHPLNPPGVVTVSLGVAAGLSGDWGEVARLSASADVALYEAKKSGRNRCAVRGPEVAV
ncbi:MAG: diguanylate cyclase [Sphingomonas sp.]|nr:diguanylate cyclase [Sphingomonas sp.]